MTTTALTKEDWIAQCATRYIERAGVTEKTARDFAEACFENRLDEDDSPKDAADEDMSYWNE